MIAETLAGADPWTEWGAMCAVFALIAAVVAAFVWEKWPIELTALGALAALLVLFEAMPLAGADGANRLDAARLLEGFANPGLVTVAALLVIGQALVQTGALEGAADRLYRLAGRRPAVVMAVSLVAVAALSSVLNNTPVVVIFIPILGALAERLRISASRVLLPLSYAAILGGATTLIGSSTNLLVAGVADELGLARIGFFDFLAPAAVLAAAGLPFILFAMPRILPDRVTLAGRFAADGRQFIAQVAVRPASPLVGERAVAGRFPGLPGATVRVVQRGEHAFLPPFDGVTLAAGDMAVLAVTRRALTGLLARHRGALHPSVAPEAPRRDGAAEDAGDGGEESWRGDEQILAEVMIPPASRMVGLTLEQFGFRRRAGCIVLGVQRRSRMFRQRLTDIRLEAGDGLLIQGPPGRVAALRENSDAMLVERTQQALPRYRHARRAALIFAAVVAASATAAAPIVVAAVAGAAAMLACGCLDIRQAARALDRTVILMVASTLALGAALFETGGAAWLAERFTAAFAGAGPGWLLSALFLAIALATNLLSNNASAVLFAPVAAALAQGLGLDPAPFLHTVILAANCSFATPVGYQTNLLVMAPGNYRFADYARAGAPLILLLWAVFTAFAPWYYGLPLAAR